MNALVIKVLKYFAANPNPTDDVFHQWAESEGLDVHQAEAAAYMLATKTAQFFTEGRSVQKGTTPDKVDPEELKMGIEVEKEHMTSCLKVVTKIALDHLAELPNYYTLLKKMEEDAGVEQESRLDY